MKTCPACGGEHDNTEWGEYCSDSCVIDARYHRDREFRQYDRDHPGYVKGIR